MNQTMKPTLQTELHREDDACVVAATGDVDLHSAPMLREALNSAGADTDVVLDLTDVGFIDSTGLGVIVGSLKRIRAAGKDLRLRNPNFEVKRVLTITGLDNVLTVDG